MGEPFGRLADGRAVEAVEIGSGRVRARILTLGAILQDLRWAGLPTVLGASELAAYECGPLQYFGTVVGPVAGRIAGATGTIDGVSVVMEANEGPNALHSGQAGLHRQLWEIVEEGPAHLSLALDAGPGSGGLPGGRRFQVTYRAEDDALSLELTAETDAPTWMNLTHHAYWHLGGGEGTASRIDGHAFSVAAGRYLPVDGATLPTGQIAAVEGTRFDFRQPRVLGNEDRLDHCFCLDQGAGDGPWHAARLVGPSGRTLSVTTDAPGLQVHTGDGIAAPGIAGHGGAAYGSRPGLALEPQGWPDAPHWPAFPSIRLDPGRKWRRMMRFAFSQA